MVLFPSPTLIVFTFCVLWLKLKIFVHIIWICFKVFDKEFIDEHRIGESIRIWFEFKAEIVVEWVSGPPIPWMSPSPSPGPSRWLMWSMQMNLFCEWVSSSWISYPGVQNSFRCLSAENLCLAKNRKNCKIVKLRKNHVKSRKIV